MATPAIADRPNAGIGDVSLATHSWGQKKAPIVSTRVYEFVSLGVPLVDEGVVLARSPSSLRVAPTMSAIPIRNLSTVSSK